MKLHKVICAILILVLLSACSSYKDINYDKIFDDSTFSMKNNESLVDDNGKSFSLKLQEFVGVLEIAEANIDGGLDCSLFISGNVTDATKIVLVDQKNEVTVLKEFTKDETNEDIEEIKFVSYQGINKIKIISNNRTDVNLKLTQSDLIFKYNQNFPFSPLFGDKQVGLFASEQEVGLFTPEQEKFLSI